MKCNLVDSVNVDFYILNTIADYTIFNTILELLINFSVNKSKYSFVFYLYEIKS